MNDQATNIWPEQQRRKVGDNLDAHQQFDQRESSGHR